MSPACVSMIGSAVSEPPPYSGAEARGALQQAAVQVEDVARIGLAAGGPAQQQRDLAVGLGVLGQVVVDDQRVLALLHELLADGAAGVGRKVLERGRLGSGCATTMVCSIAP
jgi:hypothetical protein